MNVCGFSPGTRNSPGADVPTPQGVDIGKQEMHTHTKMTSAQLQLSEEMRDGVRVGAGKGTVTQTHISLRMCLPSPLQVPPRIYMSPMHHS